MIINSIYAILATLSFAILFNIRGKKLIFSSLGGGIGWFFFLLFNEKFNISTNLSLLTASIIIGVYSEFMARILKSPVTTFAICAIIPLVPGNGMYYSMYESISGNASKSLTIGLQTLASAGSIATGFVLVSSVAKFINIKKTSR